MRTLAFSNSLLLPLLVLVLANLMAFAWRSVPPASSQLLADTDWQVPSPPQIPVDLRPGILAGNHWGEVARADAAAQADTAAEPGEAGLSPEVRELNQRIQHSLQGIVRRGDWVLLFARDGSAEKTDNLPLELRSGDQLPDSPWQIGQIWADRIQLVQQAHESLIVPLYPLAEPATEQ